MKVILFLSNHFITLYSYRKELINKLVSDGHRVYLSLPASEENNYFREHGCKIINTEIDRRGINPIKDINLIRQYKKIFIDINPDIIFSYTVKPNIYGALVSNILGIKHVCNVTGTGVSFSKKGFISKGVTLLYRLSIKKCFLVFFQNAGDKDYFVRHHMVKNNWSMLPGSGCNLDEHPYTKMPGGNVLNFIFIGRIMELKGIAEYLECAKKIKTKYSNTRFLIAGWNEEDKYKSIIAEYEKLGYVKYIGFQKNISEWIEKCHCTILPSHGGEGVPNVLLESAAAGRACIASKINGSLDAVDDGVTGFLFEVGNILSLVEKVEKFIELTDQERAIMGAAGHDKIVSQFDRSLVIEKYYDLLR